MRKLIVGALMLACSLSTVANAASYRLPGTTLQYQQSMIPGLRDNGRWQDEERRRRDEEWRRQDEERRRQEDQRRQDEERRRQEDQRRRDEEQRRRDEEQRRRQDEQRRQNEEQCRRDEENRRRDEENRRRDEENRRRDEENRRRAEENRRPGWPPPGGQRYRLKMDARQKLFETDDLLAQAQRLAIGPERFRLDDAVRTQRKARDFYQQGFYSHAIDYSSRAQVIARDIIDHHRRPEPPPPAPHHRDKGSINIHLNL